MGAASSGEFLGVTPEASATSSMKRRGDARDMEREQVDPEYRPLEPVEDAECVMTHVSHGSSSDETTSVLALTGAPTKFAAVAR